MKRNLAMMMKLRILFWTLVIGFLAFLWSMRLDLLWRESKAFEHVRPKLMVSGASPRPAFVVNWESIDGGSAWFDLPADARATPLPYGTYVEIDNGGETSVFNPFLGRYNRAVAKAVLLYPWWRSRSYRIDFEDIFPRGSAQRKALREGSAIRLRVWMWNDEHLDTNWVSIFERLDPSKG